jgi:ATP-dependent Clp protease, protease subunit
MATKATKRKTITDTMRNEARADLAARLDLTDDQAELVLRSQIASPEQPGPIDFRNSAKGDAPEILLYGVIGFDPWDEGGMSAGQFASQLAEISDADEIHIRINSPGGNVFDGFAMFNLLREAKPRIIVDIDGIAASSAATVAMAGDVINIAENAMLMIHNTSGVVMGDRRDALAFAEIAERIDGQIAAGYANRTGKRPATIRKMMDAETHMTAAEAVADKFADNVIKAKRQSKNAADNTLRNEIDPVAVRLRLLDLDADQAADLKLPLDSADPPAV